MWSTSSNLRYFRERAWCLTRSKAFVKSTDMMTTYSFSSNISSLYFRLSKGCLCSRPCMIVHYSTQRDFDTLPYVAALLWIRLLCPLKLSYCIVHFKLEQ